MQSWFVINLLFRQSVYVCIDLFVTWTHHFYKKAAIFRLNIYLLSISPTPQVEWVKMGHQLPNKAKVESHGKLLIVPRVDQEDNGKYMCKAKNSLAEVVHYFTVTVEGKHDPLTHQICMKWFSSFVKCKTIKYFTFWWFFRHSGSKCSNIDVLVLEKLT